MIVNIGIIMKHLFFRYILSKIHYSCSPRYIKGSAGHWQGHHKFTCSCLPDSVFMFCISCSPLFPLPKLSFRIPKYDVTVYWSSIPIGMLEVSGTNLGSGPSIMTGGLRDFPQNIPLSLPRTFSSPKMSHFTLYNHANEKEALNKHRINPESSRKSQPTCWETSF
jgi:hypothetical protein